MAGHKYWIKKGCRSFNLENYIMGEYINETQWEREIWKERNETHCYEGKWSLRNDFLNLINC